MHFVDKIRKRAKGLPKRIVLPEKEDQRVRQAYDFLKKEKITEPILLGKNDLDELLIEEFTKKYYNLYHVKGITIEDAQDWVKSPLNYASMMVREGLADGFVAGAIHTTPDVIKAGIFGVGIDEVHHFVSSCFIMILNDRSIGENGILIFADCGVNPNPTVQQLADIGICSALLFSQILGTTPKVAMLSYSTKGSATGKMIERIRQATQLAKDKMPDLLIDGEIQLDAAISPEIANIKCADSPLRGKANILIYPDLNSGNIAYKLVQRLAHARAIGPLFMGLRAPCSDLSRGCDVDDIIDCVAICALRSCNL